MFPTPPHPPPHCYHTKPPNNPQKQELRHTQPSDTIDAMAQTPAERSRQYRARKGARERQYGPIPWQPCGTPAAYARHTRHGETPCAACTDAERTRVREAMRARRARLNP